MVDGPAYQEEQVERTINQVGRPGPALGGALGPGYVRLQLGEVLPGDERGLAGVEPPVRDR
jgi:hypothetical protein